MNLSQISRNIIKTNENSEYVNVQEFASKLNIELPSDHLPNEKLKCYSFAKWICTDTLVGGKVYFLGNSTVAYSWQQYRNSNEEIEFTSKQAVKLLQEYLLSLAGDDLQYADLGNEMGNGYELVRGHQLLDKKVIIKETNEIVNVVEVGEYTLRVLFNNGDCKTVHINTVLVPYKVEFIDEETYRKKVPYIAKFHGITNHRGQVVHPDSVTIRGHIIELFYDADHPNDRTEEEYTKNEINDYFFPNIDVNRSGEYYAKLWHENKTEWVPSTNIMCNLKEAVKAKRHLVQGEIISEITLIDGTVLHRIGLREAYIG